MTASQRLDHSPFLATMKRMWTGKTFHPLLLLMFFCWTCFLGPIPGAAQTGADGGDRSVEGKRIEGYGVRPDGDQKLGNDRVVEYTSAHLNGMA